MRPSRSRSLIYDLYGGYIRELGGWAAIGDLIRLLRELGMDEPAVRSAVSRMTRKGMLVRSVRDEQVGYELSARGNAVLEKGDLAIFAGTEPADLNDGWVLVTFSIPEVDRDRRHQLRAQLTWLGFGNLGGGIWIAPRRVLERAVAVVAELGLESYVDVFEAHHHAFGDVGDLVHRCWDLDGLNRRYEDFIAEVEPLLRRWEAAGDRLSNRDAFVEYTAVLHRWRKMPYLDPGLPAEVLPERWLGRPAGELFQRIVALLEKRARRHVETVVG